VLFASKKSSNPQPPHTNKESRKPRGDTPQKRGV
jgi:hypothetical protein